MGRRVRTGARIHTNREAPPPFGALHRMDEVLLEASGIREFDYWGGGACLLLPLVSRYRLGLTIS